MTAACYILHRKAYRETSLLIDLFTYDHGRVSAVAKGAYKAHSAKSAQLQPFQPLLIEFSGRSSLRTITTVEAPSACLALSGAASYCGLYINELVLKLTSEGTSYPELFALYAETLGALAETDECGYILRRFEIVLLGILGLLPALNHDWLGSPIERGKEYYLSEDLSFVDCTASMSSALIRYQGETLLILDALKSSEVVGSMDNAHKKAVSETKRLCHYLIDLALDGRNLKSRDLFKQHRNMAGLLAQ